MTRILLAALLLCCAAIPGCCLIFGGTRQEVMLSSTPARAEVVADGAHYETPATVRLARGRDHTLTFRKPGYEPQTVRITRRTRPLVALSFLYYIIPAFLNVVFTYIYIILGDSLSSWSLVIHSS